MDDIKETIRKMVAEILEMKPEQIGDDDLFIKDLGMDSLRALEIMASVEKKYQIRIEEDMLPKFTTLNETVKIVADVLNKQK
ncbi:MAG: acyl carrier protein [Candidatus Omnitrophica bacterium]|nr:acyl carrier protein [Candidatus Omnitrophota bacterium]